MAPQAFTNQCTDLKLVEEVLQLFETILSHENIYRHRNSFYAEGNKHNCAGLQVCNDIWLLLYTSPGGGWLGYRAPGTRLGASVRVLDSTPCQRGVRHGGRLRGGHGHI